MTLVERGFEVRTGSIAIGDPAMGLVVFNLGLSPGQYRLERGALMDPQDHDGRKITLDGPFLFVVDAIAMEGFLKWLHRTFEECQFVIPEVAMRLNEAAVELGLEVGFYWEDTLSGRAQEGTYALDTAKITENRQALG